MINFLSRHKSHILSLFVLTIIVLLHTRLLLQDLTTNVPGSSGFADITEYVWNVGWTYEALTTDAELFYTDALFAPFGADLRLNTFGVIQSISAVPFIPLVSVSGAYNIILLLTFLLNGYLAYGLFWRVSQHSWASLVASAWFIQGQPLLEQMNKGRAALGGVWLIMGSLWLGMSLLEKPRWWKGVGLGLLLLITLLTDFQILLFTAMWLVIYGLSQLRIHKRQLFETQRIMALVIAGLIVTVPFLLFYYPFLSQSEALGYATPSYNSMLVYSLSVEQYIKPNLWWYIFGGYPFFLVFLLTPIILWKDKKRWLIWWLGALFFFVLSLGPTLKPTEYPMPLALLGQIWEPLRQFRVPGRLTLPAMIGVAMLTSLLLAYILPKVKQQWLLWLLVTSCVVGQYGFAQTKTPMMVQQFSILPIYEQLAQEEGEFAILEVPFSIRSGLRRFGQAGGEMVQIHQHIHGKRLLNGSMARLPDAYFDTYRQHKSLRFLAGEKVFIDEAFYTDLEEVIAWADIRYIIIHPELITDEQLTAITSILDQHPLLIFNQEGVYEVR